MKLIVGLGNPGKEYENTRHNIGFMFLDYYLDKNSIDVNWKKKFNGLYMQTSINNEKIIFLKPQSFMNLSGGVVNKYLKYFEIDIDDMLVICDDLDLFVGNYKLKNNGSCGGHNGLRDIEKNIGSTNYKRLRIGISNDKELDTKDYVLGKLSKGDTKLLNTTFDELCGLIEDYFNYDFEKLMSLYNKKNR
jgi:PTH1 family peptidyl-tRNA hydrolase